MAQHPALDAICRQGRLVITPDEVHFRPFRRTRRMSGWAVARRNVSGVTSRIRGVVYELTIHTRDGRCYGVAQLNPPDAFAAVTLLGYAWPAGALRRRMTLARAETAVRCKWGRLEIGRERVALQTRPWHQRHAWTLPRAAVSGVGYHGASGAARVRDLVIFTRAGTAFPIYDLAPTDALAVVRALGLVRDAYPVGHAPIHEPPEPELPLPGSGSGQGVVVMPAPAHVPMHPRLPSFRLPRSRPRDPGEIPAHAAARVEPGTRRRGFSTVAGMLAAVSLLAAAAAATIAGHGLPENWDLLSAHPADGSLLPINATQMGAPASGGDIVRPTRAPTATVAPTATATAKPRPTATPAMAIPAVVSRPKPTPTPVWTATPVPTSTPVPSPSPTPVPSPTAAPSPTPTTTPMPSPTSAPSPTPTAAPTATATTAPPTTPPQASPTEGR